MFSSKLFTVLSLVSLVAAAPCSQFAKRDTESTGTATYFAAGLGACGWTNSGSDYIVAVNSAQYSQDNCGKTITITNTANGKSTTAEIADECPSCSDGDLDLSEGLFSYLNDGDLDAGVFSISWSIGGSSSSSSSSSTYSGSAYPTASETGNATATATYTGSSESASSTGSHGHHWGGHHGWNNDDSN